MNRFRNVKRLRVCGVAFVKYVTLPLGSVSLWDLGRRIKNNLFKYYKVYIGKYYFCSLWRSYWCAYEEFFEIVTSRLIKGACNIDALMMNLLLFEINTHYELDDMSLYYGVEALKVCARLLSFDLYLSIYLGARFHLSFVFEFWPLSIYVGARFHLSFVMYNTSIWEEQFCFCWELSGYY